MKNLVLFVLLGLASITATPASPSVQVESPARLTVSSEVAGRVIAQLSKHWSMTVAQLTEDYGDNILTITETATPDTYLCEHPDGGLAVIVLEEGM
jgi:hypothetical protein